MASFPLHERQNVETATVDMEAKLRWDWGKVIGLHRWMVA